MTNQSQLWKANIDPDQYWVHDSRLYMFRGAGPRHMFVYNTTYVDIAGADSIWSSWFGECTGFFNTQCFV